jgi:glycosyltransferase involved in cell wall biosynthesis
VVLLLSDYEGLPLSVIEAMACGCVPVVSDIESGVSEVVAPDRNGIIFEPRNWGSLVEILAGLGSNRGNWKRLAQNASKAPAKRGLTVDTMGARYTQVIDDILAELGDRSYVRPLPLTTIDPEAITPPALAKDYRIPPW